MTEWVRDEKGASTVTYLLLLPLFILIVLGASQMWRIISIKQSLHVGTYQTVRCLSMYDSRNATLTGCESLLTAKLDENGLIDEATAYNVKRTYYYIYVVDGHEQVRQISDPTIEVEDCGMFRLETELTLPGRVVIPYLPAREVTLHEWKTSYMECTRGGGWAPPSEGTPITPLN